MLQKTKGVVLHSVKYGDNGMITSVYTELFGRVSFIVQGIRSKKSSLKINYLQSLCLLELECYYKPGRELQRIKEIKNAFPFSSIPFEIKKSSQVIFLAEVLNKVLREEESQPKLFEFIFNAVQLLDLIEEGVANFYLVFLVQFSRFLGFGPTNNFSDQLPYYDLNSGVFVSKPVSSHLFLTKEESMVFSRLLDMSFQNLKDYRIDRNTRNTLPDRIIDYFELHSGTTLNIKSLDIIREIFN